MTEQTTTETKVPGAHWLALANETADPLECIAMALTGLLEVTVKAVERHETEDSDHALVAALDEELAEQRRVVDAVRATVGKSTAGWADKIREALGDGVTTDEGATQPNREADAPPARDADVEVWRSYAAGQGLGIVGLDQMNRSQIRTALGISNA